MGGDTANKAMSMHVYTSEISIEWLTNLDIEMIYGLKENQGMSITIFRSKHDFQFKEIFFMTLQIMSTEAHHMTKMFLKQLEVTT